MGGQRKVLPKLKSKCLLLSLVISVFNFEIYLETGRPKISADISSSRSLCVSKINRSSFCKADFSCIYLSRISELIIALFPVFCVSLTRSRGINNHFPPDQISFHSGIIWESFQQMIICGMFKAFLFVYFLFMLNENYVSDNYCIIAQPCCLYGMNSM